MHCYWTLFLSHRHHLCPISFPYNVSKWTDIFGMLNSMKFHCPTYPSPTTSHGLSIIFKRHYLINFFLQLRPAKILHWTDTTFKNALSITKHSEHWECDVPFGHRQATCVSCSRLLLLLLFMSKLLILIWIQKGVNWESLLQFCNCR